MFRQIPVEDTALPRATSSGATPAVRPKMPEKRYSLQSSLIFLVAVCVLPALALLAYLGYSYYQLQKSKIYGETVLQAQRIAAEIDRELSSIESGLHVLATAESLRNGDLQRFHRVASAALKSQTVRNYVLIDRDGRQLLNTLRPYGEGLPATGSPMALKDVFITGKTVLADLFIGPVTKKPLLAMGVPVYSNGEVIYSLNIGLSPSRLTEILMHQDLPAGWLVGVFDRAGTIVGRNMDAERFVGQKAVPELVETMLKFDQGTLETVSKEGIPVVTSHVRLANWGWTIGIGAPKDVLEASLVKLLLGLLATALGLFALGLWLAVMLGNRVLSSVQQLNNAALALGNGQPVVLPDVQLQEADAVGLAIVEAARLMDEVKHRAYHDPLTGLANRALFYELLQYQIATAEREGGKLAVLALDLDNFKTVNDVEGHPAGDVLLREVASRITGTIRASDLAARIGGDEFSVLLWHDDFLDATETANRLLEALAKPYPGIAVRISASIGIAIYPQGGDCLETLLENADQALYKAKHAGKNACIHFANEEEGC